MAHIRYRYISESLERAVKFSPLVGILGHRQVGKTTVMEGFCRKYHTLDFREELQEASKDPEGYLEKRHTLRTGIDECQLAPALFPALKERVRKDKRPGQLILSGSVRFTSRRAIRESLTGRITHLELYPFVVSELDGRPLPDFFPAVLGATDLGRVAERVASGERDLARARKLSEIYLRQGGLPGVCFIRDEALRNQRIESQLETLLDRDLRQVEATRIPFIAIREFVEELSRAQGKPLNFQAIARRVGVSPPSLRKLLNALDGIFLVRLLPIEGDGKGPIVYFEDVAEHLHVSQGSSDPLARLEHFIYVHARAQFKYRLGSDARFFQYRTRGGAVVPMAIKSREGVLGIIPMLDESPSRSNLFTANSFLKTYAHSKVLFLHPARKREVIHPRMLVMSVHSAI